MLIPQDLSTSASSTGRAPIQISLANTTAANATIYTVPTGRKFVGRIFNTSNNAQSFINGVWIYAFFGSQGAVAQAGSLAEYTLLGGTVIKEGGTANTTIVIGVESDA